MAAALSWALGACQGPPPPPPGFHSIGVPYFEQVQPHYSGIAAAQMFIRYAWAQAPSQDEIWSFLDGWGYARWYDPGATPEGIALAVQNYSMIGMIPENYSGTNEQRLAIADMETGITQGYPTIAIVFGGTHAVIVKGGTWQQLYSGQPSNDSIQFHDSAGYANIQVTMANWLNMDRSAPGGGVLVTHVQRMGQRSSGSDALDTFDALGGTYGGDPEPPVCEPDPDHCGPPLMPSPAASLLQGIKNVFAGLFHRPSEISATRSIGASRRWVTEIPGAGPVVSVLQESAVNYLKVKARRQRLSPERRATGPRSRSYVPHPHARSVVDVVENVEAGIRQMKLGEADPAYASLLQDPALKASSVRKVRSVQRDESYTLVAFGNQSGRQCVLASLDEAGWLLGLVTVARTSVAVISDSDARTALSAHGLPEADDIEWLETRGTAIDGLSPVAPIARVKTAGEIFFVSPRGNVYVEDANGDIELSTSDGAVKLRKLIGQ